MELIDEIEEGLFHKAIFQLKNGLKIFFLNQGTSYKIPLCFRLLAESNKCSPSSSTTASDASSLVFEKNDEIKDNEDGEYCLSVKSFTKGTTEI